MPRRYSYSANFDEKTESLLREAKFLGEGHNGIVFDLPEEKVLKIFIEEKCCKEEGETLKRVMKSKYFPRIYAFESNYIVRDKVKGIRLDMYIRENGLSFELSKKIFQLLNEFENLGFTKLDTRCKDIYVNGDEIMMIDPKHCYRRHINYPRHLLKGLRKLKVSKRFFYYIKQIDEKKALDWEDNFKSYEDEE